jgi:hypothetical protein
MFRHSLQFFKPFFTKVDKILNFFLIVVRNFKTCSNKNGMHLIVIW